jgi:DNA-binding beta-propeller fold protein YncE
MQPPGELRYPGKVAIDGDRIAISDTGNHRVLIGTLDGSGRSARVHRVVGGEPGFADGESGRLSGPQGLAFDQQTLYVADSGNHAVRAIDLASGALRTVAGTGRQLRSRADAASGALSSPWDLALHEGTLHIALAGVHRIVSLDLATGVVRPFCGSGREEIIDGPHAEAALAQPMGLATDGRRLYFADAETSAVRWANLDASGEVRTVVGTGLFDFGDRDGTGDSVRLQHPQAVMVHDDGRILVADSYNDSLKWIDPEARSCTTFVRGLHEPGGLARAGGRIYVADTNAHRVVVIDAVTGDLGLLELDFA